MHNDSMKTRLLLTHLAVLSATSLAPGQGTLLYDQQAGGPSVGEGDYLLIQTNGPIGQSFVPSLSSVGFVALAFHDPNPGNNLGATVYVNLRQDSITGPILGSTQPLSMPDGFAYNATNFFFSTPIAITPGTTYYLEPVVQSGDLWDTIYYHYGYPNGSAFIQGNPNPWDLWFREGIVVPEPSSALLISIGAGALVYARRRHIANRRE
jgi:hypothetical protein